MDHRERTTEIEVAGGNTVEAVDPTAFQSGVGDQVEEPVSQTHKPTAPPTLHDEIAAKLPESWSTHEVNTFIETYYGRIPEMTDDTQVEKAAETLVEEVDESTLPISSKSRNGLTLDSYVIIDGRSVTLRAIYDAGQLVPTTMLITEGTRRFPRRAIEYGARVVDRPMFFSITEETYKTLSKAYPQTVPHDEALTPRGIKNVQSKTTVLTADTMERVLPNL